MGMNLQMALNRNAASCSRIERRDGRALMRPAIEAEIDLAANSGRAGG
jgi:hypothetical protein